MNIQEQIASLLAERAEIDAELEKLRLQAVAELDAAKATIAALDAVMKVTRPGIVDRSSPLVQPLEISETDAGQGLGGIAGVREEENNVSASSFKEELAMLRERTQEKRRRLQ